MSAIMFAMSCLAALWLLQQVRAKPSTYLLSIFGYCGAAILLTKSLATYIQ